MKAISRLTHGQGQTDFMAAENIFLHSEFNGKLQRQRDIKRWFRAEQIVSRNFTLIEVECRHLEIRVRVRAPTSLQ